MDFLCGTGWDLSSLTMLISPHSFSDLSQTEDYSLSCLQLSVQMVFEARGAPVKWKLFPTVFFANNSVWKWQHWKCFCFCQLKKNVTVLRLSCWTLRPWPWANIVIYLSNISAWHGFICWATWVVAHDCRTCCSLCRVSTGVFFSTLCCVLTKLHLTSPCRVKALSSSGPPVPCLGLCGGPPSSEV